MTASLRTARTSGEIAGMALGAGLATLAAIVILGSRTPLLLVLAPLGGIGLVFAARRPLLALVVMVVIEVTNVSGVLAPRGGIPFFPASLLLGLLTVGLALRDPELRGRLNAWTAICAGLLSLYLATQVVATVGSADVAVSLSTLRRTSLDFLFVLLLLILIRLTARPWTVAAAIVVSFAALSLLTVINEVIFGGTLSFGGFSTVTTASGELITTLRYGGPLPDSNFWGRHLIMGLPLAAALLTRALRCRQLLAAPWWGITVIVLLAGIYLTQSRGTFVSAAAVMLVWFVASERSVRKWGLLGLPLVLLLSTLPGIGNRLGAVLYDLSNARANGHIDPSVVGRLAAQQEAWLMFQQRPVFGFGPGTFPDQVQNFAGLVSIAVRKPTDAPHNIYAQFVAESGLVGLAGWSVAILGFLTVVVLRIVAEPRSRDRVLAAAVCAAIVGWLVASILLHLAYFRTFGVFLALAGGMAPAWPVPAAALRTLLRGVGVWLVALVVGLATFGGYWAVNSHPAVRATQHMTLVPVGPIDGWYSYALDVRSRIEFLPTFAILLHDSRSPVDIQADSVRGLLTFTATAETVDQARDQIQQAAGQADATLRESIGYQQYSLQMVGSMRVAPTDTRSQMVSVAGAGIGAGAALVTGLVLSSVVGVNRRKDEDVEAPIAVGAAR